MQARVRITAEAGPAQILDVAAASLRLGKDQECEIACDPAAFPMVSSVHARIEQVADGFSLLHLSRYNKTLLNDAEVKRSARLKAGDRIRLGFSGPTIEIVAINALSETNPIDFCSSTGTLTANSRNLALLRGTVESKRFELGNGGVIGRDADAVPFLLNHPHVSRLHASLTVDKSGVVVADLGSSNGTYVNGRRIKRPTKLTDGDRIDIGPFSLQFDGIGLVSRSRSNNIELAARGIQRVVPERGTRKSLALLDDIDLVIRPREFVCLLGPSGSGKSTLLAILSGRQAPSRGIVAVNGEDLHADFEALKEDIAIVPQKDLLHNSLVVGDALRYTAELRLPPDLSRDEVKASVTDILEIVGLTHRRDTAIRHLSGGEIKRASLANELVSRPSLLFLDEVTSGLDEQTDRDVMELFRQVADGGKTVVCITHNLANVEATCNLVVILADEGRLAFIGTPDEAKTYFDIPRLGEVYRKLGARKPEEWQSLFRSTPFYERYVTERLPKSIGTKQQRQTARARHVRRGALALRQTAILVRRYVAILRGDTQALLALGGQAISIAVLLGLAFGDLRDVSNPAERMQRTINLLLLLAVSCFWFGCNTAAKEFVKERMLFSRERDFNLRVASYFTSKLLVLALIGVLQASLVFGIVRAWCHQAGSVPIEWLILCVLAIAGVSVGLVISALARSEEFATALVPIVIIPQIILAGVVSPLSGPARWLAKGCITVYWGDVALERLLPDSHSIAGWRDPFLVVLVHVAVATALAIFVLSRLDRESRQRRVESSPQRDAR